MKLLLILIIILVFGYYLWKIINRNWQELFTTQNVDKYMRVVGELQNARIKYKTTTGGEEFNFRKNTVNSQTPPVSYTVWVKKEHYYQAEQILYKKTC